jgi:hypothetical protein
MTPLAQMLRGSTAAAPPQSHRPAGETPEQQAGRLAAWEADLKRREKALRSKKDDEGDEPDDPHNNDENGDDEDDENGKRKRRDDDDDDAARARRGAKAIMAAAAKARSPRVDLVLWHGPAPRKSRKVSALDIINAGRRARGEAPLSEV